MAKPRVPMIMYVWDDLPTLRDMTDGLVAVHAPDLDAAYRVARKQFKKEYPLTWETILKEMILNPPHVFHGRGIIYVWGGRT